MATITIIGDDCAIYNIPAHKRGDTWDGKTFSVIVNGAPLNLAGASILVEFRKRPHLNPTYTYSTANSKVVITNAATGTFSIVGGIINFDIGYYDYDIQITLSSGNVKTRVAGIWEIKRDTSR